DLIEEPIGGIRRAVGHVDERVRHLADLARRVGRDVERAAHLVRARRVERARGIIGASATAAATTSSATFTALIGHVGGAAGSDSTKGESEDEAEVLDGLHWSLPVEACCPRLCAAHVPRRRAGGA